MTEDQARGALAAFDGISGLERWIAEWPWEAAQDAWTVSGALEGWTFQMAPAPGAVRVTASGGKGAPAVWFVQAGP